MFNFKVAKGSFGRLTIIPNVSAGICFHPLRRSHWKIEELVLWFVEDPNFPIGSKLLDWDEKSILAAK